MQTNRPKILMLGTTDSRLAGHLGYTYDHLPADFDKRMVVAYSVSGKQPYAFGCKDSKLDKLLRLFRRKIWQIKKYIKYGEPVKYESSKYSFLPNDVYAKSADQILAKHPGFIPDIISIHWVGEFITPKVIRDLYEKTNAHIVIVFVDEDPLAGGCHYHCECEGYLHGCVHCPALISGKKYAHDIMIERQKALSGLPITIVGSPYDMEKAKRTMMYKSADVLETVSVPKTIELDKQTCRKILNIQDNEFVVFIGANTLTEVRKGTIYSIEAINYLARKYDNLTVCLLGNSVSNFIERITSNIKLLTPGFLNINEMLRLLKASDVFLSTTIADSGPMMVNYAFAMGVPVVSFDLGIAHSLIKDREIGCFAEYENSESVAKALEYIYGLTSEERNAMGEMGKDILISQSKGPWVARLLENWKAGMYSQA